MENERPTPLKKCHLRGEDERLGVKTSIKERVVKWVKTTSPLPSAGRPALPLLPVCLSSFNRNGRALFRPVGAIFFLTPYSKVSRSVGRS